MKLTPSEISAIAVKHLNTSACNDVAKLINHISAVESELNDLLYPVAHDSATLILELDNYVWQDVPAPTVVPRWWPDNETLWLWSDMHLGHKNVLHYEPSRRVLATDIADMDSALIAHHNDMVKPNGYVLNLGDVSLATSDKTKGNIMHLNGHKCLVMGNHDRGRSPSWWRKLFNMVWDTPILVDVGGTQVIFSHEPVSPDYLDRYGVKLNIHGHTHSKSLNSDRHVCVSVEQTTWLPVSLRSILEIT